MKSLSTLLILTIGAFAQAPKSDTAAATAPRKSDTAAATATRKSDTTGMAAKKGDTGSPTAAKKSDTVGATAPKKSDTVADTATKKAAPATAAAKKDEPEPDRPPGLYWIINTSMGKITAQLYEKEAPGTVANFVALTRGTKAAKDKSGAMTKRPYFNGVNFHRVIANFMIQTGDAQNGDGTGDCGFTIKDEIVPALKYDKPGVLGLARLNQRNTGACQFFITDKDYASLTGEYTIFGQVVDGQPVVGQIARVPKDGNDKPRTPVKIISATIKRYGPAPAAPTPTAAPAKKAAAPGTAPAPKKAPAAPAK